MNKEIIQIQLALFFQPDFTGSFEDFSLKLKNKLGQSKITQLLPVPPDAPFEIPRLVLNYDNFNINVSKNRIDLFLKDTTLLKENIQNISDVILNQLFLSIGRVGFVKKYFIDKGIEDLKSVLVNDRIRNLDLKEIGIRINEHKIIEGYNCNNIENLFTGLIIKKSDTGKDMEQEGIIVIRDVNTSPSEFKKKKFYQVEINKLIDTFDKETDNLIIFSNK